MAKVTIDKVKNVFSQNKLFLNLNPFLWKTMVRVILLHFDAFFVHFDKLIRRPPGPLCGGGGVDDPRE